MSSGGRGLESKVFDNHGGSDSLEDFRYLGIYHPFQFVLKLAPDIHKKVDELEMGMISGDVNHESLYAYSTLLHETIHWWQHIGSTAGFVLSMTYPVQTHLSYRELIEFSNLVGPVKSIATWLKELSEERGDSRETKLGNIIVNNFYDVEMFRALVLRPTLVSEITDNSFFHSVGHCYYIVHGGVLNTLANTLSPKIKTNVFVDPEEWKDLYRDAVKNKVERFYRESRIGISPVGALDIFEGQARFNQIQFLHHALPERNLDWGAFQKDGMLDGVYVEAFLTFLKLTRSPWPSGVDHPTVYLFLLVCDLALNPSVGFPDTIENFENFVTDVDPGIRFVRMCSAMEGAVDMICEKFKNYDRQEYVEVSDIICSAVHFKSPIEIGETIFKWREDSHVKELMAEYQTFGFRIENLLTRVLLAHFIEFYEDKCRRPEFFCWIGHWSTKERASDEGLKLLNKHMALFVNKAEDNSVFPRIIEGKDLKKVYKTFNDFFGSNMTYDLIRQWIYKDGNFNYNFRWLSENHTITDFRAFARDSFKTNFGLDIDSFLEK